MLGNECRQVLYSDSTAAYLARHVGHLAGLPVDVPALTINRYVSSHLQRLLMEVEDLRKCLMLRCCVVCVEVVSKLSLMLLRRSSWGKRMWCSLEELRTCLSLPVGLSSLSTLFSPSDLLSHQTTRTNRHTFRSIKIRK